MRNNNIAFLRNRKNITQRKLAEMIGAPYSTICRLESGERQLKKWRDLIATALGCAPEDLDSDELDIETVPIIGMVMNKSVIKKLPEGSNDAVEPIADYSESMKALRVKGSNLLPAYTNNDVLFFNDGTKYSEQLFLGRICYVELTDGKPLLARVSSGSKKGRYILEPFNSTPIIDKEVAKIRPIISTRYS